MRRLVSVSVLLVAALLAREGLAGAAVFGSFVNPGLAEAQRERVATRLGLEARVVAVDVNGVRYYRVVAGERESEAGARDIIARARAAGFEGAWYWPGVAPPAPRQRQPERAPTSAIAESPQEPEAAPEPAPEAVAEAPEEVPGPAAARTQDGLTLRTADTGEAIVVPRFDAVDILMDGHLDETVWKEVAGYDKMVVIEPDTLVPPRFRTVARYLYTEQGLYVGVWNEQPPETLIARLSSRDEFINRDEWGITIDTSGQGLYGYWFNVNLGGSVMDGKVAPEREFSREWDGPWDSATVELADGWSAELFLPWAMMTMPQVEGDRTMGVSTTRKVAYIDERWAWPALPFTGGRFMSALQPMHLPGVKPRQQVALFPYIAASHDTVGSEDAYRTGLDVFWRPSSNFQVTAAAYPDFGAVETDDVIINLTARETFFPEKRLFFLEGNEIFVTSGRSSTSRRGSTSSSMSGSSTGGSRRTQQSFRGSPSTVLNTRRIGAAPVFGAPDGFDVDGRSALQPTDLLGAAKVVGQSGAVRYGVLTAFEEDPLVRGEWDDAVAGAMTTLEGIGRNFGVGRVLYESAGNGRQAVGYMGTVLDHPLQQATVHAVDGHLLTAGGRMRADLQLLASDTTCDPDSLRPGRQWWHCRDDGSGGLVNNTGYGLWGDVFFTQRQGLSHIIAFDAYDDGLNVNDLGFMERNDMVGGRYSLSYIRPNVGPLRRLASNLTAGYWQNGDGQTFRNGMFLNTTATFQSLNEFRASLFLFPERWDDFESRGNGAFKTDARFFVDLGFGTDTSKVFSWSLQGGTMQEELGGMTLTGGAGFTYKPVDRFSLDLDVNFFRHDGWLRHQQDRELTTFRANNWQPRLAMDVFLSARQQLRLTMQWAGIDALEEEFWQFGDDGVLVPRADDGDPDDFALSQLTAQLRYRWQIAPLSDLFVVYTRGGNEYYTGTDLELNDGQFDHLVNALNEPAADLFVVKLRYRVGG